MALPDPRRVLRPRLYVTPSDLQCGPGPAWDRTGSGWSKCICEIKEEQKCTYKEGAGVTAGETEAQGSNAL